VAGAKLAWWREEIARLFAGDPQHPVTLSLGSVLEQFDLPQEYFEEIIDGMQMDLDQSRFGDFRELNLYCHRVASVVGLLAAEILGYANRQTPKYAHHLGVAFQLTNILRDVREDAHRGRIYLPQDELIRFGIGESVLMGNVTDERLKDLFRFQAQRAHDYYNKALALLPDEDRYNQRVGLIMAAIYRATLDEIEKDGFRLLEHSISLTPLRKLWLAWTTALRESRRHTRQPRRAA
jgi:phytoene synthase